MKITIVLPPLSLVPIGGYKVVYEHANQLCRRGHEVVVVHPLVLETWPYQEDADMHDAPVENTIAGNIVPWFPVKSGIRITVVPDLSVQWIPDADVVMATAWQTAEWVQGYPRSKGERFCFVQDYEHFMMASNDMKKRMASVFSGPMHRIAISSAVSSMLTKCGTRADSFVPNGIDFDVFHLKGEIDDVSRMSIGFPSRPEPFKRTVDAIAALEIVRDSLRSDLSIWSFGRVRPIYFPPWVSYHERLSDKALCVLYNSSCIFLVPSLYEGWGLPGFEAMACGAALVSTDNGGVNEYAKEGESALLSPPGDIHGLADNVLRLIHDRELRINIARHGYANLRHFTWEHATDILEQFLSSTGASLGDRG